MAHVRRAHRPRLLALTSGILALASLLTVGGCRAHTVAEPANFDFTLKDMNGRDVKLSQFKGKPLMVNFWATWCGPCQLETPEYVDLYAKYKDRGLTIVGVSINDSPQEIQAFASQFKVPYPLLVGLDREDVMTAFGVGDGIPITVFIGADGKIRGHLEGLSTSPWLEKQIQALF